MVAVGKNVTQYKVGDRVVNIAGFSFAEYSEIPSAKFYRVTHLPDDISYETAIGLGLQALTAYTLAFKDYAVQKGDYFLVHAAAGGVGLLLTQLLRYLGGTVIGTVSSQEKADVAKQFGAHYTIDYTKEDIAERIKKITNEGVHVVYDSVGKSVYDANIDSLRPFGVLVHYGFASGAIDKVS